LHTVAVHQKVTKLPDPLVMTEDLV